MVKHAEEFIKKKKKSSEDESEIRLGVRKIGLR